MSVDIIKELAAWVAAFLVADGIVWLVRRRK